MLRDSDPQPIALQRNAETFVIGDIHGCRRTLDDLLARCDYREGADRLWLVGDLINRGAESVACLEWAIEQGDRLTMVLGNHDLRLLARRDEATPRTIRSGFDQVLAHSDRDRFVAWLRERPLIHREHDVCVVHAGLAPQWTLDTAEAIAKRLEDELRGDALDVLLEFDRKRERVAPEICGAGIDGTEQQRWALQVLTSIRVCDASGSINQHFKGTRDECPPTDRPWWAWRDGDVGRIFFGHWAALGRLDERNYHGLDTGCAWGGELTAVRLRDGAVFQAPLADGPMGSSG